MTMRRGFLILVALTLVLGVAGPASATPPAAEPLEVVGPWAVGSPDGDAFAAELDAYAKNRLGIEYSGYSSVHELIDWVTGPNPPDVIVAPQPGLLNDLTDDLVDLSDYLNPNSLRRDYSDYLIDVATVGGAINGVPVAANLKSMVWYRPATFDANGYAVPETFAELVALSDTMVADGFTPWCNYIQSARRNWLDRDGLDRGPPPWC